MRRTFAVLLVVVPAAACGFPDVRLEAPDAAKEGSAGSSSGGSSGGDDSSSSSGGVDAEGDSRVNSDGSSSGDSTMPDAPGLDAPQDTYVAPTDAPLDSPQCDRDGDGFDGPQCLGGTDCCDFDNMAFPGQTAFFPNEDVCHSWDYNCDMMVTEQYKNNLTCGGTPALGCTGGSGFTSTEGCGQMAPVYLCGPTGALTCGPTSPMTETQGCH